jgi:hypothetical protein
VHVAPLVDEHPVQEAKVFVPEVAAAVSVTLVPELYVSENAVLPDASPLLSFGATVTTTALAGLVEFTVRLYVVGGGVEPEPLGLLDPPQPRRVSSIQAVPSRIATRKFEDILRAIRLTDDIDNNFGTS